MSDTKMLEKYMKFGHHFSCTGYARKSDDSKHPCNCGYDQAAAELAELEKQIVLDKAVIIQQKEDKINLRAALDEAKAWEEFHPRAVKLLRKRKNFVVVAEDEPYLVQIYDIIREHEKESGRWTADDETYYQQAVTNDRREW